MGRLVALAARRPAAVLAVTALLAVVLGLVALRLEPATGADTFVGKGSDSYQATERYYERFGDDAVVVLVKEKLTDLVLTPDLGRMINLEGCLSGRVPQGATVHGGPGKACDRLAQTKPVKVVFGPGTFINESVNQLTGEFLRQQQAAAKRSDRAARAAREIAKDRGYSKARQDDVAKQARQLVNAEFTRQVAQLALRYGITSEPSITDPNFVSKLVFDAAKPAGTPKARFHYLFPGKDAAIIQVRLKPELSDAQRKRAIADLRDAVKMPEFKLERGGSYTVTGAPVVLDDLATEVSSSIRVLLAVALLVMGLTLLAVFRVALRVRLLPLVIALVAAAMTFGALSLAGASLTMASIAVLPVLIGLAVDYAIQLQSRTLEARRSGAPDMEAAASRMAVAGAPTVATAAAATIAGFLVLVLSPVPMVRGFGILLVVGVALALVLALTAGTAALVLLAKGGTDRLPPAVAEAVRGAGELVRPAAASVRSAFAPSARDARELIVAGPAGRGARSAKRRLGVAAGATLSFARRRPERVLAVAAVIALCGWALDTQTRVETDIQKLVPQDLQALKDLRTLQRSADVGGQLDVVVEADNVATPEVINWMAGYQRKILGRYRYSEERGCGKADVCPAFSLPSLFRNQPADQKQVDALLNTVPPYFSQSVITADKRTATLSFGIKLMPLEEQKRVVDAMRDGLNPPDGVRAELAGLPVLAADANGAVSSDLRRLLSLLVGLLAVLAVLRIALRSWERALVPLVPIVLATGWSSFVLFALRIPLNPMSVTLGALVIAISTEFSVLLSERYRSERRAGHAPREALDRTYRSTGAAVLASGATAIAGFAVLIVSDMRMLRDFGFVTVVDLAVSLLGVLVVLPAVLLLAERDAPFRLPARPGLPRLRLRRRTRTA